MLAVKVSKFKTGVQMTSLIPLKHWPPINHCDAKTTLFSLATGAYAGLVWPPIRGYQRNSNVLRFHVTSNSPASNSNRCLSQDLTDCRSLVTRVTVMPCVSMWRQNCPVSESSRRPSQYWSAAISWDFKSTPVPMATRAVGSHTLSERVPLLSWNAAPSAYAAE